MGMGNHSATALKRDEHAGHAKGAALVAAWPKLLSRGCLGGCLAKAFVERLLGGCLAKAFVERLP
eukprot:350139-Chlamydomonas_euryale.AAC.1